MVHDLLASSPSILKFIGFFIMAVVLLLVVLLFVMYAILAERKVIGFMQLRIGPNQLGGKWGLLQTTADVLKLLLKEDSIPSKADKVLFIVAPVLAFTPAFMVLAVIPFTDKIQFANVGVGLLYYMAISGMTIMGVLLGGWSSNNKYALLGGMRGAAQMISYEIPLVMSVVGIIMVSGSLNLNDIVHAQHTLYFILGQPIAFLVYIVAATAELNRTPFDLPESESELVAGYHVEYTGFRFAFFMLTEYVYLFGTSALATVIFLGGWYGIPGLDFIPGSIWFALKFSCVVYFMIWIRATLPRIRADHLMSLGWKILLPVALFNILLTALLIELGVY